MELVPSAEILPDRGLRSRALFKRDKTRPDWRAQPNWQDQNYTVIFWSRCLGKSGKNLGNKRDRMGPLSTTHERLK